MMRLVLRVRMDVLVMSGALIVVVGVLSGPGMVCLVRLVVGQAISGMLSWVVSVMRLGLLVPVLMAARVVSDVGERFVLVSALASKSRRVLILALWP